MGRSQIQLKRWDDASATVTRAQSILETEEFIVVKPQMTEIMSAARSGGVTSRAVITASHIC